jgi:hypothetical protein
VTDDKGLRLTQRLYDWLLRKRLIRGHPWGQPGISQRLLRIRFPSACLLSLPALLLCVWYAYAALVAHWSHRDEVKADEPLTVRLFQLHLHDKLMRDWHRLVMPEPQHKSTLPTYGLVVRNEKLDQLASRRPTHDEAAYHVEGQLVKGSRVTDVQVQYRGGKHWHYSYSQNSWKVRVKDGKVFDGLNTFSFINSPDAVPFEEELILDVAREQGLVTPDYFPFRLLLNKAYMGVYFFEAQPDEGLLRRAQRPLGSLYSGSDAPIDAKTGMSGLFKSADYFTKVVQGVHQQLGERQDIESLIAAINQPSAQAFANYADRHLDVERFAKLDALDVVFGCNQHDFRENHKLYFDPYRDRFEPIAWNYHACKHEREFNRTENPLLLRLKLLPDYLTHRNRIVYELLRETSSSESLRRRTLALLENLEPDQARDPYWDAYHLLPGISPYYSLLRRPVNRDLQNVAIETRLFELGVRNRYLTDALEEKDCSAVLNVGSGSARTSKETKKKTVNVAQLNLSLGGNSAYTVTRVSAQWPTDCHPDEWRLLADTNLTGSLEMQQDRALGESMRAGDSIGTSVELYPGTRFESRPPQVHLGRVRVASDPRTYRFFIESVDCVPVGVTIHATSLVTEASLQIQAKLQSQAELLPSRATLCDDEYQGDVGQKSPHPWCYSKQPMQAVALGPGTVELLETKTFEPNQSVVIAPGTTFRLAPGVSLIFAGKVVARGTAERPIAFEASDREWGGIAVQGPGASGSRFDHVRFSSGSRPAAGSRYFPGMINVHDTADIAFNDCTLSGNVGSSVALHVAETQNLSLAGVKIRDASFKAIDLEYTTATLNDISVVMVAGDAITLSGSRATIKNSKVLGWTGDGISVNQRSELSLSDVVLAGGNRGLFVHDASNVRYDRLLLLRDNMPLRLNTESDWFSGKARLEGEDLFAVGCKEQVQKQGRRQKALKNVHEQLSPGDLATIRNEVLRVGSWADLDARMTQLLNGDAS